MKTLEFNESIQLISSAIELNKSWDAVQIIVKKDETFHKLNLGKGIEDV